MAEILACCVGPAIELGKCIAAPIERQFNYLFCFNSNIRSVNDETEKLNAARNDLQRVIAEAERNREVILDEVTNWLTSDNEIQRKITGIETRIQNVQSGCLAMKSRFSLSRKAKKMTEAMKEHRGHCKFDRVSLPAPPPAMLPIPLGDTYEFHSRKHVEEEIIEVLRDKEFNMMGICGMGGVGKTIMAKRIINRAREEDLFDEVVMVAISQQVDVFKIQREIAESLGLMLQEETLSARAIKLHDRLMDKKRTLMVLDDVWDKLHLENIGIPCQSHLQGCTILFTSRNRDVLNGMGIQKVGPMQTLTEMEAWFLFREKAGNWLDNSNLLSLANQVAEECKGLPIALVTVGCALKDEKRESVWDNALDQLKNLSAVDMPDVIREVYNPLKLSYELLENQQAKSLFLLCSLFPEDSDVSLDNLTMCSVGLGMFGQITLRQARGRVSGLVKMLKSRSLLLDDWNEHCTKMHDVVHDVAVFIASEEGLVDANLNSTNCMSRGHFHSDCKWISVFSEKTNELSDLMRFNFPSIHLLMMHHSSWESIEIKEDFCFTEGMEELKVLSLESVSLISLPQTMQLLKNLRTLHLVNCTLESISVVGKELTDLEILCCRSCYNIMELPVEIGRLNRLKLLEFSHCSSLEKIAPGTISKLVELEELKITNSFKGWESIEMANEKERRKNVSLKELESLLNLTHLEIDISDYTLAAQEICLSTVPSIVKYCIRININPYSSINWRGHEKCMYLNLPRGITLVSWIHEFLSSTEALFLEGDGTNNLVLSQAHKYLKFLSFEACSTVKKLVDTTSVGDVFPALESLMLSNLPNLEEIYDDSTLEGSNSFKNLQELTIIRLPTLKYLWKSSSHQNLSISNLCSIHVSGCGKLRNLLLLAIAKNEGDQSQHQFITFPKLKRLGLHNLQSLTSFCRRIQSIEFPVLAKLDICGCPNLTSLVSSCSTGGHDDDGTHCHLFCNQKDSIGAFFPMLESLRLSHLPNLKEICDASILVRSYNSFKNLKSLILEKLPALKHLWKSSPNQNIVSLTNLSSIKIQNCSKLHNLLSLAIAEDAFLQLEELRIEDCELMEEIFSIEENRKNEGDQSHRQIITFPKLKKLVLLNLRSLTTLCRGIESINFPVLEDMEIRGCTALTSLISSIWNNHQNSTCGRGHEDDNLHLFCRQKVAFGGLKDLKIRYENISVGNIWCHQIPLDFFSGLEKLVISDCGSIKSLFSSSIAGDLVNLKVLKIYNCLDVEKVIVDEEKLSEKLPLYRLEKLTLSNLPKLRSFCVGNLVNLKELRIKKCKEIKQVIGNEQKLCEKSPFLKLEELTLKDLPKLESFCVGNLINLKQLRIERCKEIEEVIQDEQKLCEKYPFPRLEYLTLKELPKLRIFCKWSCDIELPSLERVSIDKCPLMESLTMGSLSLPKLEWVEIDEDGLEDVRDLNGALRFKANEHLRTSAQKPASSSTEGKEREGEEDKGEIKKEEIEEIL